jgi:hydroxymethylpyrimidine/phosphomethylpyrimidine kinase
MSLEEAVATAKRFVTDAIRAAPQLGRGHGPINHCVPVRFGGEGTLKASEGKTK